ncbi:MAG: response regulator [Armatimonadetes bacterium]|nr:response regulator [Armatimonadota bacterium]
MNNPIRFVVIEDEVPIRRFLRASLGDDEATWYEAATGEEGIRLVAQKNPEIVLLDLGLPDIDGLEVLRRIREWSTVPIIVLSARGKENDKVGALDQGADDYLTKPFSVGELMARVRVALRHSKPAPDVAVFEAGDLRVDFAARVVALAGEEIRLTQIEYKLLSILCQHAGKVVTQKQLLTEVWGPAFEDSTHTLRVHMANLRQKIDSGPGRHRLIQTETGVGYRLRPDEC